MTDGIPLWFVIAAIVPSLLVAWSAGFVVRRLAARWGLLDRPNAARKVHTVPTPLGGGLAIWLGVVLPFAAGQIVLSLIAMGAIDPQSLPALAQLHLSGLQLQTSRLWLLLAAGTVLMLVGLIDDRRGLPWQARLLIQFAVAGFCVSWNDWRMTAFLGSGAVTWFLSAFWIVLLVNSFNMLDNMDGLSAGVAAISAGMLAAVMLLVPAPDTHAPQLFVGGFLLVLIGALLGFLWHNRPPARLFMGDAGSYFLGFCLAVCTLQATFATYDSTSQHTILAPLCVLAVPLYDFITVVWIRLREGRSPFHADKRHFSHRLVELGLSKGQAVATIYLTSATCGLGALLLHQVDVYGAVVILVIVFCMLSLIAILESTSRRRS
jgi:UDP-GlcNAc:undecaprenyl-phosphate GlcNAc-1-phosphate transferase